VARYHSRQGVVYLSPNVSTAASAIAAMASFTVDQSVDIVEVTSFGDLTKTYVVGLPDGRGEITGYFDDSGNVDTIFNSLQTTGGVNMYLYPSTAIPNRYWYGNVFLSPRVEANIKDAVKVSMQYVARTGLGRL